MRAKGKPAGDCVDCRQCVAVCPTGVDIRHGSQLGCIQCGLCIDACDTCHARVGRPTGLIAYDNDINAERRRAGVPEVYKLVRPRTMLYVALIAVVGVDHDLCSRQQEITGVNVLHDRNPLAVQMSDGSVRNGYTMRLLNKNGEARRFQIHVEGLSGAHVQIVGEAGASNQPTVDVGPDQTLELRLLVIAPEDAVPKDVVNIAFVVEDVKWAWRCLQKIISFRTERRRQLQAGEAICMNEFENWQKRYSVVDYVFGEEPNAFLFQARPPAGPARARWRSPMAKGATASGSPNRASTSCRSISRPSPSPRRGRSRRSGTRPWLSKSAMCTSGPIPKTAFDVVVEIFTQFSTPAQRARNGQV